MPTLYGDNSQHHKKKKYNLGMYEPGLLGKEKKTSLTKEVAFLKNCHFLIWYFLMKNNIAKLVICEGGNCFNRSCQLL